MAALTRRREYHWECHAGTSPARGELLFGLSLDADPEGPPPGLQQVGLQRGAHLRRPCPLLACEPAAHSHMQCSLLPSGLGTNIILVL